MEKNLLWLQEKYGDRLDVRIADIRNSLLLEQAVAEAQHVFHFAAQVAVTTSIENPAADFASTDAGPSPSWRRSARPGRPLRCSSPRPTRCTGGWKGCASGETTPATSRSTASCASTASRRDTPLDFLSPYGCSKGCADQYVLDYARTYGIAAAVFRMSCIYGPHQFGTEDQGWVAHFAIQTLRDSPITLYGDGCQIRDLLFVEDLVDAFLPARDLMPQHRRAGLQHRRRTGSAP